MPGFLGRKEMLTRERVKEILINLEEKVTLLGIEGEKLILKISFLIEYHKISIGEKDRIIIPFNDFRVEDWGDGIRKIAHIE